MPLRPSRVQYVRNLRDPKPDPTREAPPACSFELTLLRLGQTEDQLPPWERFADEGADLTPEELRGKIQTFERQEKELERHLHQMQAILDQAVMERDRYAKEVDALYGRLLPAERAAQNAQRTREKLWEAV